MASKLMEADSTSGFSVRTHSAGIKYQQHLHTDALAEHPANIEYFESYIQPLLLPGCEELLMHWLQGEGLIACEMPCASRRSDCRMVLRRNRRAADGMSWECLTCVRRRPARSRSVFAGLACSIAHILQILLAWSEDKAHETVASYLGLKEQEVLSVYERVEAAAAETMARGVQLRDVVLAEMFPSARPHTSPDSSDTHHHRILMLADTHTVPTRYYLHVMSDALSDKPHKGTHCTESAEVSGVCSRVCERDSVLVVGEGVPTVRARQLARIVPLQSVARCADSSLAYFLSDRLWRQAATLCGASRDVCGAAAAPGCAGAVQRYLHVSLYRLQHDADGLYPSVLGLLAKHYQRRAHAHSAQVHPDNSRLAA